MQNKILIFGQGFIGNRLQVELGADISDKRILFFNDADEEIARFRPKVIINCVGHTGEKNVDDCEKSIDKALAANTFVPIILAEAALRNNIRFVHISSGCIYHFDYAKDAPIDEEKTPDFFDLFYSRTKIYSEEALKVLAKRYPVLIARIRIPLDDRPHPKNVLSKLIAYKKVIDTPNSVTYIPDFVKALKHLLSIEANGIYNVVNKGALEYPKLMQIYKRHVPSFEYKTIKLEELNLVRTNLILSTNKLEQSGFKIRDINEVLEECVQNYLNY